MFQTKVSSKGQVVLPAELREMDRIIPGQVFQIERVEEGSYRLVREAQAANAGVVDWLLDCPETGWFAPIDSDATDSLKSVMRSSAR